MPRKLLPTQPNSSPFTTHRKLRPERVEALPVHRSARILYGKLEVVRYRTCRVAARFLKGRVVRAVWVELERPDRRDGAGEERLLLCTDPDLPATEVITSYAKRWSVEPLFAAMRADGPTPRKSRARPARISPAVRGPGGRQGAGAARPGMRAGSA